MLETYHDLSDNEKALADAFGHHGIASSRKSVRAAFDYLMDIAKGTDGTAHMTAAGLVLLNTTAILAAQTFEAHRNNVLDWLCTYGSQVSYEAANALQSIFTDFPEFPEEKTCK